MVLAAIGTIADVMPIVDENRIIVSHGIELLKNKLSDNNELKAGVYTLLNKYNVDNAQDIAFKIVPMLNASRKTWTRNRNRIINRKNTRKFRRAFKRIRKIK